MKFPTLNSKPVADPETIKSQIEEIGRRRAKIAADIETIKERRRMLPFGSSQKTLDAVNADLRAKEDEAAALFEQEDAGGRLLRDALAAQYERLVPGQFKRVGEAAAAVLQAAEALSAAIAGLDGEIAAFKKLGEPLVGTSQERSRHADPMSAAMRRAREKFAGVNIGSEAEREQDSIRRFTQNRLIEVDRSFSTSAVAELLRVASSAKLNDRDREAA